MHLLGRIRVCGGFISICCMVSRVGNGACVDVLWSSLMGVKNDPFVILVSSHRRPTSHHLPNILLHNLSNLRNVTHQPYSFSLFRHTIFYSQTKRFETISNGY